MSDEGRVGPHRQGSPIRILARPAFENRRWNPYNWLLYSHLLEAGVEVEESTRRRVLRGGYDVLHLHWPEQHLTHPSRSYAIRCTITLLAQLWWTRLRGTRVVWTVHNLQPHERRHPRLERVFRWLFLRQLDGYICLTARSQTLALERFPRLRELPGHVIPHGHYREIYPNRISREQARDRLGLPMDARVLLFIGAIREYKNVPELIQAFRGVVASGSYLVIAGRPADTRLRRSIEGLSAADRRIRLHLDFIAEGDLQLYLNAADAAVLPHMDTLNSGSAILALSFDRPVLIPTSACGEELRESVGHEWVRTYEGALDAPLLEEALDWATDPVRPSHAGLEELGWDTISRRTARAFASIIGVGAPAPPPDGGHDLPLVSVITPCYDAAPFVAETIESVRRQSYPAIEHIVVDDGSTDGSWDVITRYGDHVRAVRLPRNRGGCHARNRGAGLARGELLMFLDADDTISPDAIESMVAAVRTRPRTVAFCDWKRLRGRGGAWTEESRARPLPGEAGDALAGWLTGTWAPPCALLWRRDSYEETGGWDESLTLNQDGDIVMRALADGIRLVRATGGLGFYRGHDGRRRTVSSSGVSEERLRSAVRVLEKLERRLEEKGTLAGYKVSLGTAYHRLALRALQQSLTALGRELQDRGDALGGSRAVSRTAAGRVLGRLLGVERKEAIAVWLARRGIGTRARRRTVRASAGSDQARGSSGSAAAAPSDTGTPARVAICIPTYRRPVSLRRLLESLIDLDRPPGTSVEVIVVDNDESGSAAAVCEAVRGALPWPLAYRLEPDRGISQARNRAVAEAAGADLVAFIDDDEAPDPGWLVELLRIRSEHSADVVAGPVLPVFEGAVPDWIMQGSFFERPRFATGTALREASTCNVLIEREVLTAISPPFDESFGLTGGEDTHFFARVHGAGYRIVWADDAIVREFLPSTRTRPGWLLRRAFRSGSTWSVIACSLRPTALTRLVRIFKGTGRVAQGVATLPGALLRGRPALLRSAQRIFLGLGSMAGAFGICLREYRTTTGQ